MDARTLEQVILDLARKNWSAFVDKPAAAAEIADAVRKWMLDTPGAVFHDRIKELEAEVANLKHAAPVWPSDSAYGGLFQELKDKAVAYEEIRKRFPFWPGNEFWAFDPDSGKIVKRIAQGITVFGVTDNHANGYRWDECHPTADACRAAIPVEE